MNQTSQPKWIFVLSSVVILSILLESCGSPPADSPPIVVQADPISGNPDNDGTYINILINSLEFTGAVSNLGDLGNLQLIMVTSDESGHSDALICPYGGVIEVHTGDRINPCQAGLTYPKNILHGNLHVVLIAMDVKNQSDLADIGANVITSGLSAGLATALQGTSAMTPQLAIGLIALSAVIGYAGTKTQEYVERNYVIGSQSFTMSSQYNWNNGQPVSASSLNQQVIFGFTVQESSTATGHLVGNAPSIEATSPPPASPEPQHSSIGPQLDTVFGSGNWFCFPDRGDAVGIKQHNEVKIESPITKVDTYVGSFTDGNAPAGNNGTAWLDTWMSPSDCPASQIAALADWVAASSADQSQINGARMDTIFGHGNWRCIPNFPYAAKVSNLPMGTIIQYPFTAVDNSYGKYGVGETMSESGSATVWLAGSIPENDCP